MVVFGSLLTPCFPVSTARIIITTATGPSGRTARGRDEERIEQPETRNQPNECSPAGSHGGIFFVPNPEPGTQKRGTQTMDFSKLDGLIPAVVQDHVSGEVLMVGFMNQDAWDITRRTGYVTFYSRTRNTLWTKGETSGNRLAVRDILIDCDDDTVLVKAERQGDGNVCHTGERTCFFQRAEGVTIP
jgi:phosphoribosyl-AMP cyclohydrolase